MCLFWVFGYNYRMNDKVARIGKYGFTEDNLKVQQAIEKYCRENNCSRGSFTRDAIMEKLERDGFLSE